MIYPTRFGLAYLGIVLLVFLLGTNYQNNIILLISYLLASFFITVMFHSFFNFSSLNFYSETKKEGFAGDALYLPITITTQKEHFDINIHFTNKLLDSSPLNINQCKQGENTFSLTLKLSQRGQYELGRVTVFSEYSLGLFKSKTVLDFGHFATIYPKPIQLIAGQFQLTSQQDDSMLEASQLAQNVGIDDFSELKAFVKGESRARTAWKQLAKGQGHFSKHYHENQGQLQWLKLADMPGEEIETRLGYLSYLIAELTASKQPFGLDLSSGQSNDSMNIEPDTGFAHQKSCLVALALYK